MKKIIIGAQILLTFLMFNIFLSAETGEEFTVKNKKITLAHAKKFPSGSIQSGRLLKDWQQKGNIYYKGLTEIEFFENGQVKTGTLGRQALLAYKGQRKLYPYGTKVFFSEIGKLESVILPERVESDQPLKLTAEQEFYLACQSGDLVKIKKETQNGKNKALLTNALIATVGSSSINRLAVVKYLVNLGAEINYSSEIDAPLVFLIIPQHKIVPAKTKTPKKQIINIEDPEETRKAIIKSNEIAISMLQFLISKKLNLAVKNKNGVTPIHYAIDADAGLDMFQLLIKNGADYKSKSNEGQTPLERTKELNRQAIYKYLSGLK